MQQPAETDVAALLDRLLTEAIPSQHGREAWQALIRAHATLMRQFAGAGAQRPCPGCAHHTNLIK